MHTIEPSSSCILHGATDNGTPETEGFQQYHFGVKSTSLDRSHLPAGELGRDRLGRLFFRMIFDAGALTFGANDALPYEFMDAFLDALMNDIGWTWLAPPEQEVVDFVRVRDSLGFWTPIGNYFQLPPDVGTQGLTAAMVDWGMDTFVETRNTEWLFSFAPAPNVIYLTLRGCWNKKWDGDDDMDYCFGNASWTPPLIVDEPDLSGWFQPEGTPALDINDVDATGVNDANHGLWIVYRAHAGAGMGICKKQVPIAPNRQVTGSPPTRVCDWTSGPPHTSNHRPGVGHYTGASGGTHEVVVYADADDSDKLKSFEWDGDTGDTGWDLVIPEGQCPTISQFRPEVVNHDGHVWTFWVGDQPGSNIHGLCYSRLNHSVGDWEPSRIIPFDGDLETCGIQFRSLGGPPEAVERNGVVNLAIRDAVLSLNSWVWMIQLDDINGDGQFWECDNVEECAGGCFEDCSGDRTNWEERSTWVPHTRFDAASPEIGDLATTEHLHEMAADSTAPHLRQDYTFFYNPLNGYFPGTDIEFFELGVHVRESW